MTPDDNRVNDQDDRLPLVHMRVFALERLWVKSRSLEKSVLKTYFMASV